MTLDRTAARARCVRASNEAYTRRCLTGNISMVIEEDLPAALDELDEKDAEIERLRGAFTILRGIARQATGDPTVLCNGPFVFGFCGAALEGRDSE